MQEINSVSDVEVLQTAMELREAARNYNWDYGVAVPVAIASHPKCDLTVALELFWLSEAISIYTGEMQVHTHDSKWVEFCQTLTSRILSGHYPISRIQFRSNLTAMQAFKLRKQGVPDLLINGIHGQP